MSFFNKYFEKGTLPHFISKTFRIILPVPSASRCGGFTSVTCL